MAYIGNSPGVASQRVVTQFTATSNQTTFIPTSGYTIGYLDVFLNGVKLVNGEDYTASNGTTVVLATGAASGDSVEVVSFIPRGLSDGWLKSEADSRYLQLGASFSGDVSGTYSAITLANSGVTAGSYGSATNIPAITVDSKGRLTSVTNTAVSIPSGSLTFTGDVTGSGSTGSSTSLTLASVGTAGTYTKITTDAKGRVTSGTTLASSDLPTYTGTLTSSQITTALGFTPENLANKAIANGYASLDSTGKVPTAQLSGFVDQTKPNIRPTLNLDFANSKIVDSRITFTRSTTATYYDLQGILKYAQPDEPRIDHDPSTGECRGLLVEEQRTNIMTYSANLKHTDWQTDGPGYGIQNYGIAPDGTQTAYRIVEGNTTSVQTRFIKSSPISTFSGTTFTFSMYVKSNGTKRNVFMLCQESGLAIYAHFDIVAGTVVQSSGNGGGTLASAQILNIGNGWFRISISGLLSGATAIYPIIHLDAVGGTGFGAVSYTGDGSSGVYIWGVQFEAGAFATSYIPSTTTFTSRASNATYFDSTGILRLAGTNQPRYGYGYDTTSGKWVSQGLVLEAAATNIVQYSQFSSSAPINDWVQFGSYGSLTTAPDGLSSAIKLVTPSGSGVFGLTHKNVSLTSGTTYTCSVFAKAGEWTRLGCRMYDGTQYLWHATVNLNDGSVLTGGSAVRTVYVGNGWWRCSFTGTSTTTSSTLLSFECHNTSTAQSVETGDGTSGIYLWGAQLEAGYVATSYIPTYGATATRAADVSTSASTTRAVDSAVIKSSEFTKLNSSTAGTLYGEGTSISGTALVGGVPALVGLSNSVDRDTHRFILRRTNMTGDATYAGFNYRLATVINGTSYSIDYSAAEGAQPEWEDSAVHKTIFAIDTTSQQAYGDGISAGITSISIPSFDKFDQVEIGQGGSSSSWNGHIRKVAYYNKRLSNTQLQALTQ